MIDPFELADRQIQRDAALTAWHPPLHARKRGRMLASPFGFFRGTAPLYYELLRDHPVLAAGGPGEAMLVGDMHLENVGAYRDDRDEVIFGLNDFDDARWGPVRLDVVRLAASVLLAARAFRASGPEALGVAGHVLAAHHRAYFDGAAAPARPGSVERMVAKAARRTRRDLLDARAPEVHGRRALVRGERYFDLPAELAADVDAMVHDYLAALGERAPKGARHFRVGDAAERLAGTGSVGRHRVALLLLDDGDAERLFELKECAPASADAILGADALPPASRVFDAARALVAAPTRQLAPLPRRANGRWFVGRKLCPEEDKLDLGRLAVGPELDAVARTIGHLLGCAHRRSARDVPAAWTTADRAAHVDAAARLAGLFEAAYLAYARRASPEPT